MQKIGTVTRLQIQIGKLKINEGDPANSYYDPANILAVEQMRLLPQGAIGVNAEGLNLVDIHNSLHHSHRNNGRNALSVGFTPHYQTLQAHFGPHIFTGAAGENIILEGSPLGEAHFGRWLVFQNAHNGKQSRLHIDRFVAPCQQFSKFCTQNLALGGPELKETLQFLGGGKRGFMLSLPEDSGQVIVRPGDEVFLED
jgi:MOSC domain-containing protein YiiM